MTDPVAFSLKFVRHASSASIWSNTAVNEMEGPNWFWTFFGWLSLPYTFWTEHYV